MSPGKQCILAIEYGISPWKHVGWVTENLWYVSALPAKNGNQPAKMRISSKQRKSVMCIAICRLCNNEGELDMKYPPWNRDRTYGPLLNNWFSQVAPRFQCPSPFTGCSSAVVRLDLSHGPLIADDMDHWPIDGVFPLLCSSLFQVELFAVILWKRFTTNATWEPHALRPKLFGFTRVERSVTM